MGVSLLSRRSMGMGTSEPEDESMTGTHVRTNQMTPVVEESTIRTGCAFTIGKFQRQPVVSTCRVL